MENNNIQDRVKEVLCTIYDEGYTEECYQEKWDLAVKNMLEKGLTNDEAVKLISDIGDSEIFCDEEYVLAYLNDITVFTIEEFLDYVKANTGSVVYTKLSTDKVVVIGQ